MASLYSRATPRQAQVLRIVEGAVRNAMDAHPDIQLDPRFRRSFPRSVAKRAAGTLTSQWREVLAAGVGLPSEMIAGATGSTPRSAIARQVANGSRRGAPSLYGRRSPLRLLWKEISMRCAPAKARGEQQRYETYVEILRLIDKMLAR
jgi:hypothetical protein